MPDFTLLIHSQLDGPAVNVVDVNHVEVAGLDTVDEEDIVVEFLYGDGGEKTVFIENNGVHGFERFTGFMRVKRSHGNSPVTVVARG